METIWLHTAGVNNSQEIYKNLINFQKDGKNVQLYTYDNGEQKYSCLFLKGVFAKMQGCIGLMRLIFSLWTQQIEVR